MVKEDIILLFNGLSSVKNLVGQKFGYAVARNIQTLKPEVNKIEDSRKALIENYAKKVDGKLVAENGEYVFEDKNLFDDEYAKLLKEEVDVNLFTIKLEDVPKEATAGQINGIYNIITE